MSINPFVNPVGKQFFTQFVGNMNQKDLLLLNIKNTFREDEQN
jgi:hypothetical protein